MLNTKEELKGQLAEALPGATQIFADALFNESGERGAGDVKKLFKAMEEGKVGIAELSKVIDFMATLSDEDMMARMMQAPGKRMQIFQTAVDRMFMAFNDAGGIVAMTAALDAMTDAIVAITKGFKEWLPVLKEIWAIARPLLVLWATVWGVGKITAFFTVVKGGSAVMGGLVAKVMRVNRMLGSMTALQYSLIVGWRLFGAIIKRSFIAVGILFLIDMMETLQGKVTVLSSLMGEGGVAGTIAKVLVGAFRTMQMLMELIIAGFHGFFTGDWGFFQDSWDRWRESMNSLFPFDEWTEGLVDIAKRLYHIGNMAWAVGKMAVNPMSVDNALGLKDAIAGYQRYDMLSNTKQGVPNMLAKAGGQSHGNIGLPNLNLELTINAGDVGDPKKVADIALATFRQELPLMYTTTMNDIVMLRVPR